MMSAAERNCVLIADLATERPALRKSEMVSIRRLSAANQTRMPGDKFDVISVTNLAGLRYDQHALVDRAGAPPILCFWRSDRWRSSAPWQSRARGSLPEKNKLDPRADIVRRRGKHARLTADRTPCPGRAYLIRDWANTIAFALFRSPGRDMSLEEAIAFLRGQIADYKLPETIERFEEFPVTGTGKIQRHVLRDLVLARRYNES